MSVEKALDELTGDMPKETPVAAIIQEKAQNAEKEEIPSPEKVPPAGKKPRGRPRKTAGAAPINDASRLGGMASAGERAIAAEDAERLAAATLIVACMEQSGYAMAGDDAAMNEAEKGNLSVCWEKYLKKVGINDIPPGIAVTLFTIQYYSRVLTAPKAKPFVAKLADKFKSTYLRLRNARFNNRDDGKRKDNSSENDASIVPGKRN